MTRTFNQTFRDNLTLVSREAEVGVYGRITSPARDSFPAFRYRNRRARESGAALRGHIMSQHGGKVLADCPACAELSKDIKHDKQ